MRAASHRTELEELMAWLDGELPAADAERVRAHVARCDECRRMESDMRQLSARMSQWTVTDVPPRFRSARRGVVVRTRRWMQIAALLLFLVAGAAAIWEFAVVRRIDPPPGAVRMSEAGELPGTSPLETGNFLGYTKPQSEPMTVRLGGAPMLVRTARLTLVPQDFENARAEMDRIVVEAGGFMGQIFVTGTRAGERSIGATLRIPRDRLDETLKALKGLGRVTYESQQGDDVTQRSVDLDARLSNARASELRLKQILETRTGRLSDVLDVEREIARVRGEIEEMEAQRKSLDRRISYAEVTVQMNEERKAAVDLGPLPVGTRLRDALVDGWTSAITSALEATLLVARFAPVLLLWTLILAVPAWWVKRRYANR